MTEFLPLSDLGNAERFVRLTALLSGFSVREGVCGVNHSGTDTAAQQRPETGNGAEISARAAA
jgi:hypothetical protein